MDNLDYQRAAVRLALAQLGAIDPWQPPWVGPMFEESAIAHNRLMDSNPSVRGYAVAAVNAHESRGIHAASIGEIDVAREALSRALSILEQLHTKQSGANAREDAHDSRRETILRHLQALPKPDL